MDCLCGSDAGRIAGGGTPHASGGGAGPGGGRTVPAGFEPLPPTAFRITGVLVPGSAGPILTKFTILARVRVLRHVGSRTRRQIEME